MHSNNETGVIQPIGDIATLAKRHGIPFHVDAAQSIGKSHFTLKNSPIDMLTLVPHKFYGPKGVGALYIRSGRTISPLLFGAGHEMVLRPGTENIPGIAGFAKACQIAMRDLDLRVSYLICGILLGKLQNGILMRLTVTRKSLQYFERLHPYISSEDLVNKTRPGSNFIRLGMSLRQANTLRVLKAMGLSDLKPFQSGLSG
jgi:cysteine sulfinate desulfinase/cysteine desulfurase-like protein